MDHRNITRRRLGAAFVSIVVAHVVATLAPAQTCPGQGSLPQAAALEGAPFPLGCAAAPDWPAWHLWTPPHRAPAPRPGYAPGDACALPRVLVRWRCTGWFLWPVAPEAIVTMGYVLDRAESPCGLTP